MTEIPEDVMKAAQAAQDAAIAECKTQNFAVYEYPFGTGNAKGVLDAAIARAILAERDAQRERDAKIAEATPASTLDERVLVALAQLRQSIAAAIRKG